MYFKLSMADPGDEWAMNKDFGFAVLKNMLRKKTYWLKHFKDVPPHLNNVREMKYIQLYLTAMSGSYLEP